jgi:hypothetical protein
MLNHREARLVRELIEVRWKAKNPESLAGIVALAIGREMTHLEHTALVGHLLKTVGVSHMSLQGDPSKGNKWRYNQPIVDTATEVLNWIMTDIVNLDSDPIVDVLITMEVEDKLEDGEWTIYSHVYKQGRFPEYCSQCGGHESQHRRFIQIMPSVQGGHTDTIVVDGPAGDS